MAGSTGKMTREAIAARGPQMRLVAVYGGTPRELVGLVVAARADQPFDYARAHFAYPSSATMARSYSIPYLLRIARGQRYRRVTA